MISYLLFSILLSITVQNQNSKNQELQSLINKNIGDNQAIALLDLSTNQIYEKNNQFLTSLHRPGSIFKLVTAGALISKSLDNYETFCHGEKNFEGDSHRSCWTSHGHGRQNLRMAIANSCNIYFYNAAKLLSGQDLWSQLNKWGLDKRTGFNNQEVEPVIPKSLSTEENIDCAIGDCDALFVTGYTLLKLAAILSQNWAYDPNNTEIPVELNHDMFMVVDSGTASKDTDLNIRYAGKTGTSRRIGSYKFEGWFIGFVPYEKPKYAFVIYTSYGHGRDCANIAEKLIGDINNTAWGRAVFKPVR